MIRTAAIAAMLCALGLGLAPASAAPVSKSVPDASEVSSQIRSRTRLRVYPGRLLYRECNFRLVQQWGPGGPVIVPRQRCWWVRG